MIQPKMFKVQLISLVKMHEMLWNTHHSEYKNNDLKNNIWESIATKLNVDADTCRKKWKSLRYCFRKVHEKLLSDREKGRKSYHTWKYYNTLLFLKDYTRPMKHRMLKTIHTMKDDCEFMTDNFEEMVNEDDENTMNITVKYENNIIGESENHDSDDEFIKILHNHSVDYKDNFYENGMPLLDNNVPSIVSDEIKHKSSCCEEQLMECMHHLTEYIKQVVNEEEDEDVMFMKSIIIKMKKLPLTKKNELKLKIMLFASQTEEGV